MSKIGKINISIPDKVKVALAGSNLNIEGPLGKKSLNIDLETFNLDIKEGKEISIKPKKIDQNTKRLWGMNRSLINNAVIGSSKGYEKVLELIGVGYRATNQGQVLDISVGFSHNIVFEIPESVKVTTETEKGKAPIITLNSINKQLLGHVAAKIRSFRKPEPYKGKGIRYVGEYVRKKAGKTAAA